MTSLRHNGSDPDPRLGYLDAARACILDVGWKRTTLTEVARRAGVSRMTIVVSVEDFPLEQVTKQLNKLVHVIKIVELEPAQSVQRELLLVKVRADATVRSQVLEAEEDRDGAAGGVADRQQIGRRVRTQQRHVAGSVGSHERIVHAAPNAEPQRPKC